MGIQRAIDERNADVTEDLRNEFRIGKNVGGIIIDEGDIYGDGVNFVCVFFGSNHVRRQVSPALEV